MTRIVYEEVSRKIIGAAMEVLNELKLGLDVKLYERAMIIELKRRGTPHSGSTIVSYLFSQRVDREPRSGPNRR